MAEPVSARLTESEGRRFGFTVGAAFGLLGAVLWWRGLVLAALISGTVSMALIASALAAPARLGPAFRAWMGLAALLSRISTPVVLGVCYFGVITPIGLVRRAAGRNSLGRTTRASTFWVNRHNSAGSGPGMRHQF